MAKISNDDMGKAVEELLIDLGYIDKKDSESSKQEDK